MNNGKGLMSGERQVHETIEGIRLDHVNRYKLVVNRINLFYSPLQTVNVLDCACGVGYGSYLIATETNSRVIGIDVSEETIEYAKKYYALNNVRYLCKNILQLPSEKELMDIVVCFETIEHITEDKKLLNIFKGFLKEQGLLCISTPNAEVYPLNDHPFHVRHYTPQDITDLITASGFSILEVWSQEQDDFIHGWNGRFNTLICRKKA